MDNGMKTKYIKGVGEKKAEERESEHVKMQERILVPYLEDFLADFCWKLGESGEA